MFQRQKIKELLQQQRKLRNKSQLSKQTTQKNYTKLGLTLRCFGLEKNLPNHPTPPNQSIKMGHSQRLRTLTLKENHQLGRLTDFYQSQKNKRLVKTAQETFTRKSSQKIQIRNQNTDFSFCGLTQMNKKKSCFLKMSRIPSTQRSLADSHPSRESFFSMFPEQKFVYRSTKQLNERKFEKQAQEQKDFQMILRRAFIPTSKIRYSAKKKVLK